MEIDSTKLTVGRSYPAILRLKNSSEMPVTFCLDTGQSIGYHLGEERVLPLLLSGRTLDSPCAEEIQLAPGESLSRSFEVAVPKELGTSKAELVTWYSVSNVPDCRRGETELQVSSSMPVTLDVASPADPHELP